MTNEEKSRKKLSRNWSAADLAWTKDLDEILEEFDG